MASRLGIILLLGALLWGGCTKEKEVDFLASPPKEAEGGDSGGALWLPLDGSGWKARGKVRTFSKSNLYEFNNGAAESFLAYGFQELTTGDLVEGGREALVEIYDMASARGAFGRYGIDRGPGLRYLEIGGEAYLGQGMLGLWKGRYYGRVTYQGEGEAEVLEALGRALVKKLPGDSPLPAEVGLFPTQGLVAHSINYVAPRLFGVKELGEGFEGSYERGGRKFSLFLTDRGEGVVPGLASIRGAMTGEVKALPWLGPEAFEGQLGSLGRVMVALAGKHIFGALDMTEEDKDTLLGLKGALEGGRP